MFPILKLTNLTFLWKKGIINTGNIKKVSDKYVNDKKAKKTILLWNSKFRRYGTKRPFLIVIDEYFDWNFVYEEVEKLYSKLGRKSIDPVVLIKIHILKFLFYEDSLRRIYENLKYNNLYRWFIGYNLNEEVPNHSTYSQNYKRKFCKLEKDLLQTVFDKVIELLINRNCLDMTAVYIAM